MIDVSKLLYEICEDERVFDEDCELIDSGILDSYALIELLTRLEDYGLVIYPTRIDRSLLKTPKSISQLIEKNMNSKKN